MNTSNFLFRLANNPIVKSSLTSSVISICFQQDSKMLLVWNVKCFSMQSKMKNLWICVFRGKRRVETLPILQGPRTSENSESTQKPGWLTGKSFCLGLQKKLFRNNSDNSSCALLRSFQSIKGCREYSGKLVATVVQAHSICTLRVSQFLTSSENSSTNQ